MSLVLALERCRSRQHALLKQVRILCGYCICRGIQPAFRWIPSELNNADEPSRYGTDEPSKLLTSLLDNGTKENSLPAGAEDSSAGRKTSGGKGVEGGKTAFRTTNPFSSQPLFEIKSPLQLSCQRTKSWRK